MTNFAYIYTPYAGPPDGEWRVWEALIFGEIPFAAGKFRLLVHGAGGGLFVIDEYHLKVRTSAICWVRAEEFELLATEIEADYARRQCWHAAYNDVQRIRADRNEQRSIDHDNRTI